MENVKTVALITGVTGQLGHDIAEELKKRNIDYIGVGSADLDITKDQDVYNFFQTHNINKVFHCAAYTKVDLAETNKELNYNINVHGTENIAKECERLNIPMMFFSTDYVFGGEGDKPFKETDVVNPLGEYAKSKYDAEKVVMKLPKYFILRISWVFGINGNNFIKTMLKLSETKKELNVVSDQVGSPTYTKDLSVLSVDIMNTDKYGVYNATNEGYVSWADFARKIFERTNKSVLIHNVTTEEYGAKAPRPKNSRLDKYKLEACGFKRLPPWESALDRYLKEINYL